MMKRPSTKNSTSISLRRCLIGAKRVSDWTAAGMYISLAGTIIWFCLFLEEMTRTNALWTVCMAACAWVSGWAAAQFRVYLHRLTCKCLGCAAWRKHLRIEE